MFDKEYCGHSFANVHCADDIEQKGVCIHVSGHCEECTYAMRRNRWLWAS